MSSKIYDIDMNQTTVLTQKGGEIRIGISPQKCQSKHMIMGKVELKPNEKIEEHVHDYGEESMYVIEGNARLVIGDVECILEPNHMYFVPQGQPHAIVNEGIGKLSIIFGTSPLAPSNEQGDRKVDNGVCQPVLGMQILCNTAPNVIEGFRNLTKTLDSFSTISLKYKELILIGIFVANGGGRGINTHTRIALHAGATINEIMSTIMYALPICGITTVTHSIEIAQKAIDDYLKGE